MKHSEAIIAIIIFAAMTLLLIYFTESTCHVKNPYYATDCSNNILFYPKIIVIPSQ